VDESALRWPDEGLPEGSVTEGASLNADVDEAFDFVVVGSGAAGAVAAHTLVTAGHSVAIVEEGPWVKTRDFGVDVYGAFRSMMRDAGMQVLSGRSFIPMLQGRCVGGSTAVNSAIAWRIPEDVIDDWSHRFGLGDTLTMAGLEPHFDALERDLHVQTPEPGALGRNSELFIEQTRRSGIESAPMRRYDAGCKGSSRCLTGCPNGAKQGMNVTYVPWALSRGARMFTSCRVLEVKSRNGAAVAVLAETVTDGVPGARKHSVLLRARRGVVVAASTVQTPVILRRSGIRGREVGAHFQAHPGVAIGGVFDESIDMHVGATQGAESIHFRKTDRFKLETINMQPELAAARIPGVGSSLLDRLAELGHVAVWAAQVRADAEGTVRPGLGGASRVSYSPSVADMHVARKALVTIGHLLFDAGAREIWPGIFGLPDVLRSRDEVKLIADGPTDPRCYGFIASHLFGAARMGPDPRSSVVGKDFATHALQRLFVVDSSVFPTNLGVNPQHSIMAISRFAATRLAAAPPVRIAA